MRSHTSAFKQNISLLGRQLDSKITYEENGGTVTLGAEELNSVSPHFEGGILKSVMKQLDIDSNVEIPLNTILTYEFGVKVGQEYEYISFGNFVVYKSEKQEDTRSYKITCYDKMLYSMKEYTSLGITFPITIRDYIGAICTHLGLTFKNASDTFPNYDKEIPNELYLDANGNDLGYTFRDVLDELSQVTAGTICLDLLDNLEIRYINETNDTINEEYLKDVNVKFGEKYGPINSIVLSRSGESDNVYLQDDESVEENGLCELKIIDNQIMNFNDRSDYLEDILEELDGLEYYINDFSSTGIGYLELCDRYNITVGENTYSCILFNDEFNATQGLEELIHTDMPEESETDYTKADKTDRRIKQAYIIVDKQNLRIDSVVGDYDTLNKMLYGDGTEENIGDIDKLGTAISQQEDRITLNVMKSVTNTLNEGVGKVENTLVTININGIDVSTNVSAISTLISNDKFVIKSGDTTLAYFGYDEDLGTTKSEIDNATIKNYLVTGYHRIQTWTSPEDEERTGFFWIGG